MGKEPGRSWEHPDAIDITSEREASVAWEWFRLWGDGPAVTGPHTGPRGGRYWLVLGERRYQKTRPRDPTRDVPYEQCKTCLMITALTEEREG